MRDQESARFPAYVGLEAIMKRHAQHQWYSRRGDSERHARVKRTDIYMGADKVSAVRVVAICKQEAKRTLTRVHIKVKELRELLRHEIFRRASVGQGMGPLVFNTRFENENFAIRRDHGIVRNVREEKGSFDIYR